MNLLAPLFLPSGFGKASAIWPWWLHNCGSIALVLTAACALTACGGGAVFIGDGVSASLNVPPASGNGTELLSVVVQEPAGRNCARGGSRVESGLDLNRNQVLEFSEINTTRYVCNA